MRSETRPECTGKAAAMGFCLGGKLAYLTATRHDVDAAVSFYGVGIEEALGESGGIACPLLMHFAGEDSFVPQDGRQRHRHRPFRGAARRCGFTSIPASITPSITTRGARFTTGRRPWSPIRAPSRCCATRLGPTYDLESLWEHHLHHEFTGRDTAATMATMVAEPYVNHIPTMTGGTGADALSSLLRRALHSRRCRRDTTLTPLSRTVGADRVVDEMIFSFTHNEEIDWMLPGVAPTGKTVSVPLVAIVAFRGNKLYHEHIYWDQASVLVQIGLLEPQGLPVAGAETARKAVDETLPSNRLIPGWSDNG